MAEPKPPAEGWYRDPYGAHEARWFSEGTPTALVRDGGVESHDPAPVTVGANAIEPEELPEDETAGGLRRADDSQAPVTPGGTTPAEAAWETAAESPLN